MEAKAAELLAAFKNPNISVESRVAHLTAIKSDIKQKNVPDGAIPIVFDTLLLALSSQHTSILASGFSTLGHFLKRLSIQNQQQLIANQARNLYPTLLERFGDHKERVRAQAAQIFTELWPTASSEVEFHVLENAMVGKNSRAKEMSMLWLSNMTKNHGLLFRAYVPSLVACLEDADSAVRDTARMVVVELFRNAPSRARSELQKQMVARGVRKSIANAILSGICIGSLEPESSSARPISRVERPISVMSSRSHMLGVPDDEPQPLKSRPGSSKGPQERPASSHMGGVDAHSHPPAETQNLSQEDDGVEPLTVSSARDIDDLVRDMIHVFEGKESEDNWMRREKNAILLRRLTCGNAPYAFSQTYINAVKTLLDGIFKVASSLRTTLCTSGCLLIQDIARTCGPKLDPMVEIMMQNLVKLCSALKKIAAQNGNAALDAVIGNVTFTTRILQHVYWASVDKNVQLRLYAAGWLRTLIRRQARQKSTVEHGGGLDLLEKSIKKGLGDANPGVREALRSTFWTFYGVWPDRANAILSTLDAKSRTLLEKDPSNPNGGQKTSASSGKGATSRTSTSAGRSALKEAIAARKKAQMPSRPGSAQSTFPEAKSSDPAPKSSVRTVPTGAPLSSLSSAPMRPAMKPRRAELNRPATADPYASRRPVSTDPRGQNTNKAMGSPRTIRSKASTPSSKPLNAPRIRPHQDAGAGTTKGKPKKLDLSKSKSHEHLAAASHSRSDSNDSMTNPLSARLHHADAVGASEALHSPAPIVLESPPLSASHAQLSIPQSVPALDPAQVPDEEIQPMPVEEPNHDTAPTHTREADAETPLHHSELVPSERAAKPQPESMVIYEDPDTPVATETEAPTDTITPRDHLTSAASPRRPRDGETRPVAEDIPKLAPDGPVLAPPPDLASREQTVHNNMNVEYQKSPTHASTSQGASPVMTQPQVPSPQHLPRVNPVLPQESSLGTTPKRNSNNENATPHASKAADLPAAPRSVARPRALGELPLNESASRVAEARERSIDSLAQSTGDDSLRRTRKRTERHRSLSPRSKDPVKAADMIGKGLSRITSKTMDISGYRKLQALFQHHGNQIIAGGDDYYAMLEALLKELETPPTDRRDHDVKTQILGTLRSILTYTRDEFSSHDLQATATSIRACRHYDSSSHFVADLEEFVDTLATSAQAETVIEGVLQGLDLGEAEKSEGAYRSIIMGLSTLHNTLSRPHVSIDDDVLSRIGAVVSQQLGHTRPGVRKQATELCALLNVRFGADRVQKVTQPPQEGSLNLLTYYMARRAQ